MKFQFDHDVPEGFGYFSNRRDWPQGQYQFCLMNDEPCSEERKLVRLGFLFRLPLVLANL